MSREFFADYTSPTGKQRITFSPVIIAAYLLAMAFGLYTGNSTVTILAAILPPLALAGYFLFFRQHVFAFFIVFILPLCINLRDTPLGFGISLPAEPMIAALGAIFLLASVYYGNYPLSILKHPFSILLMLHIGWNFITSVTSTIPVVSFKFITIRILYIWVFYFYFILLFNKEKNILRFLQLYSSSLGIVVIYSLVRFWNTFYFGLYYYICVPFFPDHTIYSACISMLLPVNLILLVYSKTFNLKQGARILTAVLFIILLTGLIFSYSRAAWLSIVIACGFYAMIRMRLSFMVILCISILAGMGSYYISGKFSDTKVVSQQSLVKHMESVTNVTTDVSNKERINRWKCAWKMFLAKPVFGFGPGTYQFEYNPFQEVSDMTRISSHHGDRGEAHSEYLKPLSESGLPGFLSQVSIVLASLFFGLKLIYSTRKKTTRLLATGILLGLVTYYIHAFVNFFQDTDKFSVMYWGMLAMLIALSLSEKKNNASTTI